MPPNTTVSYTDGPEITLQFAALTASFLRCVVDSAGKAAIAGATAVGDGVAWMGDYAADAYGTVRVFNSGTTICIASKAIAAGALVYAAAGGKITDAANLYVVGRAKTAAGADGHQIEVIPQPSINFV